MTPDKLSSYYIPSYFSKVMLLCIDIEQIILASEYTVWY